MKNRVITYAFAVCLLCLGLTINLSAQGTTSRVTGTVTDNSGAAVAGATVTLTNEATAVSLMTTTGDSGTYVFDLIQIANYTVTVEKDGFKKFISTKNRVNINQPATVNVALEVGDVSVSVTVENSAEVVQTSSSGNIGSTIEQRTLESLPIVGVRGRNPLDLINFQPGVVVGGNTGGGVNVHGSRDRSFNFTLDGIDINESTAGGSNFTPLRPNPDSVQELQIVTSNFTAELGRSSGAQVTLVTRSGTNDFHGNLFDYYQTPRFNAKSYPETIAKAPKSQFVQHIFGGSLGGPLFNPGFGEGTKGFDLLKDKAFFFVNLQMLRAYDTALVSRLVYTPLARQGIFRYVVGRANAPAGSSTAAVDAVGNPTLPACSATITTLCIRTYNINANSPAGTGNPTATGLDPVLLGYLNAAPTPNNFAGVAGCTPDGLNTACYNFASPQHEKQYDFVTKLDFNINAKNLLYVRYAQGKQDSFGDSANGGRPIFPDSPNLVDTNRNPKNIAVNWRYSPTGNLTNEFIFGVSKYFFKFGTPEPDPNIPFTFLTVATQNTNFSYNARGVRTLQYVDNITYIRGSHTMKGGLNFRFNLHTDDRSSVGGTSIEPAVSFSQTNGFAAFALPATGTTGINTNDLTLLQNTINNQLGRVNAVSQAFVSDPNNPGAFAPAGTRWINKAKYPELDFYFQDNWRARRNLVFDLGLRYEVRLTPRVDGRPILVPDQPVKLGAAASNTIKFVEGKLFDSQKLVEPSVGFAWDPFSDGKNSIRANYRLASDRFATFLFGSSIFQNALGNTFGSTNTSFGQGGGLYRNLATVLPTLTPTTTPAIIRQPTAFGALSTNVIDPDLQYPQIHEWSLSYEREVSDNNVVEVNYIGKHAVHLLGGYNANQVNIFATDPRCGSQTFLQAFTQAAANTDANCLATLLTGTSNANGSVALFRSQFTGNLSNGNVATAAQTLARRSGTTALTANGFSPFFFQQYPQFNGGLNVFDSNDHSFYQGLEFIFKRRITNGLGFQFAYTLSKSKDNRSFDPSLTTISGGTVQSASSTPFDLRDRNINYTYSDFDRRHVFQGTYVWEIPIGKGRWLGSEIPKALDFVIGGWQLAGTVQWTSGRPFTVYSGVNTLNNIVSSTADCNGCSRDIGNLILENGLNFFFDTATRGLFSSPAAGTIGNTGRNYFIAPPYFQTDASLSKKFKLSERMSFDLRFDAKNLTNHPSFDNPTAVYTSGIFGRINDSVTNASRRIQVSGKFNF